MSQPYGINNEDNTNDLEDLKLPSLTRDYLPDSSDELDCFNDHYIEMQNNEDYEPLDVNIALYDNVDIKKLIIEEKVQICQCRKCRENKFIQNMFLYKSTDCVLSDQLICFDCSLNLLECRDLRDWEDEPLSHDTRVCPRCNKVKSSFRFCGSNKYCNFCLLKKKWTRMKEKMMKTEIISDSETDNEITIFKSKKIARKHILCDFCSVNADAKDMFVYIDKSGDKVINKNICFQCSLKVQDWKLLTDWICKEHPQKGRYCTRCKKWKSICRFTEGKKNCQYCSLKRKRLYTLQKQIDSFKIN